MQLYTIPTQTLALRKLRVLNIRCNNLSMLPTEVCDTLTDLEFMNLSDNHLQYLPENISSLTHLRTLLLQWNELSELPTGIGRLPLLTELRLEHNHLARLPDSIGRLAFLRVLNLSYNRLEALPTTLAPGLKALESLDLTGNPDLAMDGLPDVLYRLNEMYQLLHSKEKRRKVISRAINQRPAVKNAVSAELLSGLDCTRPAGSTWGAAAAAVAGAEEAGS